MDGEIGTIPDFFGPTNPNPHHMCTRHSLPAAFGFMTLLLLTFASCNSTEGTNVKMPFSGKKYMSDARHFRAVGMGQSANLSVAKSKAELEARKSMAQQVRTNLQVVSDNYASEVTGSTGAETLERFQSLAREVTNTTIGDILTIGEDIRQLDDRTYRVHVAMEIKKKAMFRFLKSKAKSDAKIAELERAQMVMMLDREIEKLEEEE